MDNKTPTRRKLTDKQIYILKATYKFRYITTDNLAKQRNISKNSAYSALEILHKNGYLGKKHQKSYRLQNKSARYYLTPDAIKLLSNADLKLNQDILNSRKRDKTKSTQFIDQQVAIHSAYLDVVQSVGKDAVIYTASELGDIEDIIKPHPCLYVKPKKKHHFFIELTDDQHLFLVKKRIRKYIEHYESDEWTWDTYPNVRIVRKSKGDIKKLEQYIEEKMDDNYLDETDFSFEVLRYPVIDLPQTSTQ